MDGNLIEVSIEKFIGVGFDDRNYLRIPLLVFGMITPHEPISMQETMQEIMQDTIQLYSVLEILKPGQHIMLVSDKFKWHDSTKLTEFLLLFITIWQCHFCLKVKRLQFVRWKNVRRKSVFFYYAILGGYGNTMIKLFKTPYTLTGAY